MFAIGHACIEYPTEFYLSTRDCQTESKAENAEKKGQWNSQREGRS